ncbi:MAG TPA: NAD(P)-dependent alcohol dehydrogenase [Candidatus Methylacidiphilales bacterium]
MSSRTIRAFAAPSAGAPLQPFTFDPGPLKASEVEIAVSHCGVCHSDLSMLDNEWGMTAYPFVPGHEAVGTVVALGSEAEGKGLSLGQRVGIGWSADSCMACPQCLSGSHNLCASNIGTIVGRHGGFAERLRAHWAWTRPMPEALDPAKAGPLLCGGITVFNPFLEFGISPTARVGIIGIGGLGHMALQFANKWGCEVHAFTTSDSKEAEARAMGAHHVHNTRKGDALKPLAGSLDLILSTINAPQDDAALLSTLAPKGRLHVVGAVLEPLKVPAFGLIMGQKEVSGSPTGSPVGIDKMLGFAARHGVAPITETFPLSKVNEALDHLRSGKARYRIVLVNDLS